MRKEVLLVEDNPDDEALALRALKKNDIDCGVAIARDGIEALDYLFCRGVYAERGCGVPPRVIFLDLNLPRMDGLEVLRRLRADDRTRLIPVVILTTSDAQEDLVRSYRLGANSFVRKPIDFNEFVAAVRELGAYWLSRNEVSCV